MGCCEAERGAWRGPRPMPACWVCAGEDESCDRGLATRARVIAEDAELGQAIGRLAAAVARLGPVGGAALAVALLGVLTAPVADASGAARSGPAIAGLAIAGIFAVLTSVVFGNTVMLYSRNKGPKDADVRPHGFTPDDRARFLQLMSGALKIPTVSYDAADLTGHKTNPAFLLDMHKYLEASFPAVHNSPHITRTVVNEYSLLYEWKGQDPEVAPVMLCAHIDVVPTPNADRWEHEPFSGHIDENDTVWGRGAIDNKHNVISQLEAVERLLNSGVKQPSRTILFAMGHDEEIGGVEGAKSLAKEVAHRLSKLQSSSKLALILDEGTFAVKGLVPGISAPMGLVGNVEKGSISLHLSVDCVPPGHSSMPPSETNFGILANAVARLEARPMPAHLDSFMDSIAMLGPELPWPLAMVLANGWLFKPILRSALLRKPTTAAASRTTTAVTMARTGEKINVIPGLAEAWVNHRIHPGDVNKERVIAFDRKVIRDKRVKVEEWLTKTSTYIPPSPTTPVNGPAFQYVRKLLKVALGVPAAPCLMIGNTDTRWYWDLSDHILRHSPLVMGNPDDLKMFHGLNERVTADQMADLVHFYMCFVEGLDSLPTVVN